MPAEPRKTVWHMEPVSANGSSNIIAHARGAVRSEVTKAANEVDAEAAERGIVDLGADPQAVLEADAAERKAWLAGRKGRPPNPYVEFLLAGPPTYDDERRWDTPKELKWAKAAAKWVRHRFPESKVVVASLHRDEAAPHVHVVIAPASLDPYTGERQWGWCKARNIAGGVIGDERAKKNRKVRPRLTKAASRRILSMLQDDCHEATGAPFGLDRGKRGSKARHEAIDETKSAAARARQLHAQLDIRETKVAAAEKKAGQRTAKVAQREGRVRDFERAHGSASEREADNAKQRKALAELEAELKRGIAKVKARGAELDADALRLSQREQALADATERINKRARAAQAQTNRAKLAHQCLNKALDAVDDIARSDLLDDATVALMGDAQAVREVYERHNPKPAEGAAKRQRTKRRGNVVEFPAR